MDWFQVLVIILAIFLAVFLILGIVLTAIIIKLTKQIQVIAENAKTAVVKAATTASNVSNLTSPAYAMRFMSKFIGKLRK